MQGVRRGHRRWEVVDDQVPGDAAEECPRRFQAGDDVRQRLPEGGPQETVARVAQHQDQGPYYTAAASLGIVDQTQATEVHLSHFPGRCILHPHRDPAGPSPVPAQNETPHRLVGHRTTPGQQQLVNAGHLQPVAGEPTVDLVGPRGQQLFVGRRRWPRPRLAHGRQAAQLVVSGSGAVSGNALRLGRGQVLAHRVPRCTRPRRNLAVSFARLPAPDDFLYLHPGNLVSWFSCVRIIPEGGPGRGRPMVTRSLKTVRERWSPHPKVVEPEQLPGPIEPASCKDGPALTQEGQMEREPKFVGIDVSKAQVDVAVRPTGQRWVVSYDDSGVQELVSQMVDLGPDLVLLESTGGLELSLVAALAAAALPVVVVNPRQVRDFGRATGVLAKTDALDAAVLAHFADAVRPTVRPLKDAETQVLNSLAARRQQVMSMLVSEKNRLGTAINAVQPRIEAHIACWSRGWKTWTEG